MNKIDQIYSDSNSIKDYSRLYMQYLASVLKSISLTDIEKFVEVLLEARDRESSIFFIGNGGSAATASHFANDIAHGAAHGRGACNNACIAKVAISSESAPPLAQLKSAPLSSCCEHI